MLLFRFKRLQNRLKLFAQKNNWEIFKENSKFLIFSDANMYIIFTKYTRLKYVQIFFVEKSTCKIIKKYRSEIMYDRNVYYNITHTYKKLNLIKLLENV